MEEPGSDGLLFPGDSEMARRMRVHPWADSTGSDPREWPASLRAACRICLTSRFPMVVWWGPDLRLLYNDAYLPMLGTKHPALGRPGVEVWGDIWHIIGPMLESVTATGIATWSEDMLLPMNRHGYWEETYWTYSYSPLHDDHGTVLGVFTAVSETTEQVVGQRRLAALRDLGAQAGTARSVEEACRLVAESLGGAAADVPFAAVYLRRPDGDHGDGDGDGDGDGGDLTQVAGSPPDLNLPSREGEEGWPLREVLLTGGGTVVQDVARRFGSGLPDGGWQTPPTEAVVLPLAGDTGSRPVGVIVLAASAGRALDEAYRTFLSLVAQQTAALVNGALAYQAQQRRAEELAELDRAKTAFFSNISHEFRTPLTLITGPVQELRDELGRGGGPARDELEVIHRNALRLGRLVNTLLDFSRIEAGRMQARYRPVDLAGFTTELASVFRAAVEKAGLAFDVDCPPLPQPVYVDREMWEKAVLNLLSNALKFTFDGSIGVRLRAVDGHAVLEVSDTGIGVADGEIPRLFERFHRIPRVRARSDEGSGIGLALVRELVELHGGDITASSTEGAGTTFTIRLRFGHQHLPAESVEAVRTRQVGDDPARAGSSVSSVAEPFVLEALRWLPNGVPGGPDSLPGGRDGEAGGEFHGRPDGGPGDRAAGSSPARGAARGGRRHVLVADDNADMREYLERLLRADHSVTAVTDGRAALEAVRAAPPDLVISDVMMPEMDGLELLSALRGDPRTAGVPVLLLSARADQEASIEGLDAGADDYLVKPFSAQELLARVRATLELSRLRNHHASWRAALIDSLQEGFFLCDSAGTIVEINTAFTELLGYGPEGLPYRTPHPWWPDPDGDPEAHRLMHEATARLTDEARGSITIPVDHRDGHRLWVAVTVNPVHDPDGDTGMVVGTFRDVTAERFTVQREAALAAMSLRLTRAGGAAEALHEALAELRDLWRARRALAATWAPDGVSVTCTDPAVAWADLAPSLRATLSRLRDRPTLRVTTATDAAGRATGAGTTLDHPQGRLGVWLEFDPPRPFTVEDQTLLALLCGSSGQALHRAHQFDQQREVAIALQRAILGPAQLPGGFAVRYEPATRPLEVGGDWYDVVELTDGRIGIVVGDCVGRGLRAATVMGQLRSACRALLLEAAGPARTLTALDQFAATVPDAECATVFCGLLDPVTGELTYSSAGHPPGVLTHPDGVTELLDRAGSTPLAVPVPRPRPEATCTMPPSAVLLLYTDGLVERRRRPLDEGIEDAATAARNGLRTPLEDLATDIMTDLRPERGYDDDVALLLYRHPRPLDLTFAADPGQLAPLRSTLRQWLGRLRLTADVSHSVLVAVGEACANAIEHGHRQVRGTIRLTAALIGDDLRLVVTDSGTWKTPQPEASSHRGRGIAFIHALMDHATVDPGDAGTTVTMHKRITR
jgi:PAS domain S-box-containing protein